MAEKNNSSKSAGTHPPKIAIVGAGQVGATFAYALLMSGLSTHIVLIDQNTGLAEGNVMDLNCGSPHCSKRTGGLFLSPVAPGKSSAR